MVETQVPFTSADIGISFAAETAASRAGKVRRDTFVAVGAQTRNLVSLFEYEFPKSFPEYVYLAANSGESKSFACSNAGLVGIAEVGRAV